jgi:hypothetical protein
MLDVLHLEVSEGLRSRKPQWFRAFARRRHLAARHQRRTLEQKNLADVPVID